MAGRPTASADQLEDDPEIPNDEVLLRRIHPNSWTDDGQGGRRPASGAFKPRRPDEPLSVYMESVMVSMGLSPDRILDGHEGWGYVALSAGLARDCRLAVARDADPGDEQKGVAHAVIRGRFADRVLRRLARECQIRHLAETEPA